MTVRHPIKEYMALNGILIEKAANNHLEITPYTEVYCTQSFADRHVHTMNHYPRHQNLMLEAQEREI